MRPLAGLAQGLAARGLDVLLFDYRGYGRSSGTPSEHGLYADGLAAFDYVREARRVPAERIVLLGHSLGSAVAIHVAAARTPAATVLVAPFPSFDAALRARLPWLPVRWVVTRERFSSMEAAEWLRGPTLFAAGARDALVPPDVAHALYERAGGAKDWVVVPGAGHNDVMGSTALWRRIDRLLAAQLPCKGVEARAHRGVPPPTHLISNRGSRRARSV